MALPRILSRFGTAPLPPPRPPAPDQIGPIIEAVAEPMLVLDGFHVSHANATARALIGEHIVGDYVRMALRQPAAGPIISGEADGPVAITGLGGHDRLWELTGGSIGPARRLLRLTDRSAQRAAEKMRVDFVANASHELRTPLAALIGFIETLEDTNGPADAAVRRRFLKIMDGEARRMQRLIDDLMSLSRIEADRYAAPRDRIDLTALLIETLAEVRAARGDDIRIVESLPDRPAIVVGDRGQLCQLIDNIVGNALKYGREGWPVAVSLAVSAEGVTLSVRDQGEGIAPEHLPRLTERFYRAEPSRSRAVGGTGLGLSIVKHIVERHRGRLDIASIVGEGTIVTVALPLAPRPLS